MSFTLDDLEVKDQGHNPLTQNILKTATDTKVDPGRTILKAATGFRLAQSDLTLDDLRGQKSRSYFLM